MKNLYVHYSFGTYKLVTVILDYFDLLAIKKDQIMYKNLLKLNDYRIKCLLKTQRATYTINVFLI